LRQPPDTACTARGWATAAGQSLAHRFATYSPLARWPEGTRGGAGEDVKCERDSSDALAGALDALVHEAVRVTVCVLVPIVVLMAAVVFVGPGVWVGVALVVGK
jgi:hypothetical protein